jgi:hypothetical protein
MRRMLALLVVAGLFLSAGCGGPNVVVPDTVPAAPKGPPVGVRGSSEGKPKAAPQMTP